MYKQNKPINIASEKNEKGRGKNKSILMVLGSTYGGPRRLQVSISNLLGSWRGNSQIDGQTDRRKNRRDAKKLKTSDFQNSIVY